MVEVMVVIVIIGILASGVLLSASSGKDNAYATTILNDLRTMKTCAYLFVTESDNFVPSVGVNYAYSLGKYMDNGQIIKNSNRYAFFVDLDKDEWWVGIALDGAVRVGAILEAQTPRLFLYGSDSINTPPPDISLANAFKKSNKAVWIKAN